MKPEPLKEKLQRIRGHGAFDLYDKKLLIKEDVKSAVEWLKEEYFKLCNINHTVFDDQINKIPKLIYEAFEDVI